MFGVLPILLTFALFALPIASVGYLIAYRKRRVATWIRWCAGTAVGCYILLIAAVQTTEIDLKNRLNRFDLDGDGVFSGEELTPQMHAAMKAVTNDTGRTLAPITGVITCPIYSGFWHGSVGVGYFLVLSVRRRKHRKAIKRLGAVDC